MSGGPKNLLFCSFCGRSSYVVKHMLQSGATEPSGRKYICEICVKAFVEQLKAEGIL